MNIPSCFIQGARYKAASYPPGLFCRLLHPYSATIGVTETRTQLLKAPKIVRHTVQRL
jgi:hypothetical protein